MCADLAAATERFEKTNMQNQMHLLRGTPNTATRILETHRFTPKGVFFSN